MGVTSGELQVVKVKLNKKDRQNLRKQNLFKHQNIYSDSD